MAKSAVQFIREEASSLLPVWWMIRDCIEGEQAIKGEYGLRVSYYAAHKRGRKGSDYYLPRPNPTDMSEENRKRYEQYVKRAVFYNFTARTLSGLVGQIFLRAPVKTIPAKLEPMLTDMDGEGMNDEQVAKRTCQSVLAYGRAGLYTDYPTTDGAVTVAEEKSGNVQPVIRHYYPWQIINWATSKRGVKQVLSLVVLEELVWTLHEDSFTLFPSLRYRVLRLDPASWVYSVYVWEWDETQKDFGQTETFTPQNAEGKTFDYIPFNFIGSEANDVWPDVPPLGDLAALNVAHYRNSADYEEACYLVGQPTPVITGVTESWVTNVLKGSIQLGSRGSISLPAGADAKLIQADANQMPLEAMKLKEDQAVAIGAKLVQAKMKVRTATEVVVDTTSEASTLHNVAKNTSAAMEQNLSWAQEFAGGNEKVQYQLNTEFEISRMGADDLMVAFKTWQGGGLAWPEYRGILKTVGLASMDDDKALAYIKDEQAAAWTAGGAPIADPLQAATPTAPENTSPQPQQGANSSVPVRA
jgi:hypothetical protein